MFRKGSKTDGVVDEEHGVGFALGLIKADKDGTFTSGNFYDEDKVDIQYSRYIK